jgi:ABC-type multidrug transport system ATPase subunit
MAVMLTVERVNKRLGQRTILRDISFSFEEGGRYWLMGPNGSGKTTLLKTLSSLMRTTSGSIYYRGREIGHLREGYLQKISLLSHRLHLYEDMTGRQNLEFFAALYRVRDHRARTAELLELLGLRFFADEQVRHYSQGMKQRLALAKAVIHRPEILLFDEPFAGLDPRGAELLQEVVRRLLSPGAGLFVLASHDPDTGLQLTDRYLYLERGRVASSGDRAAYEREGIEERLRSGKEVGIC